jgi:hypothetical protein
VRGVKGIREVRGVRGLRELRGVSEWDEKGERDERNETSFDYGGFHLIILLIRLSTYRNQSKRAGRNGAGCLWDMRGHRGHKD